jgi:hypothetical protein
MDIVLGSIIATLTLLGMIELRVTKLVKNIVKDYLSELKPNGGSSVKDSVNRLEKAQEVQNKRLDDLFILLVKNNKE